MDDSAGVRARFRFLEAVLDERSRGALPQKILDEGLHVWSSIDFRSERNFSTLSVGFSSGMALFYAKCLA